MKFPLTFTITIDIPGELIASTAKQAKGGAAKDNSKPVYRCEKCNAEITEKQEQHSLAYTERRHGRAEQLCTSCLYAKE